MSVLLLLGGLALLLIGGEALVRGSVGLAERYGLPPLLVGMVIAGFGTSMPELVVSVRATVGGSPAIAAGNVIGSNISNVLLILAIAAIIRPIGRPPAFFRSDAAILMAVSVVVVLLGLQGLIPMWQGLLMVGSLALILTYQYRRIRRATAPASSEEAPLPMPAQLPQRLYVAILLIAAGLGGLIAGADWFVEGASAIAKSFGVSEGLIGLTIVAVGTSLPELATSATAAYRGHSDIAYGNILGSNLFNLLGILGIAAIAGPLEVPGPMALIDGPIMVCATGVMLWFLYSGSKLLRWEAAVLLASYVGYVSVRAAVAVN